MRRLPNWCAVTVIVVDAAVVLAALVDDGESGHVARARLSGERLVAPQLLDLEVLSVLRRLERGGRLHPARSLQAVTDLGALAIRRVAHTPLRMRCWSLRHNLTPYDAAYVALAEALTCPLVTGDARLARAPELPCTVELLSVNSD